MRIKVTRAALCTFGCAAFAALAMLGACSDSTAPTVVPVTLDTLLNEVGSAQTWNVAGLTLGGGVASTAALPKPDACPFNSANKRFECPATTSNGLTVTMYYQLLDASNAPLSSFDATKVAAIHTVSDASGTLMSPAGSPAS